MVNNTSSAFVPDDQRKGMKLEVVVQDAADVELVAGLVVQKEILDELTWIHQAVVLIVEVKINALMRPLDGLPQEIG